MLKPSFFRERARRSLSNTWKGSMGTAFVSFITGGLGSFLPFSLCVLYLGLTFLQPYLVNYSFFYESCGQILPILSILFPIALIYGILMFLVGPAIKLGTYTYFCELMLGHHVSIGTLFSQFSIYGKALALKLVMLIKILLWSCLFIVPGIIAAYRYHMAPYILAESNNTGILEAIKLSSQMMKRKKNHLFCLQLSFIGWFLLGIITCGIAFLWVSPYIQSSYAAFYIELSGQNKPFETYANYNSPDFL